MAGLTSLTIMVCHMFTNSLLPPSRVRCLFAFVLPAPAVGQTLLVLIFPLAPPPPGLFLLSDFLPGEF